MTSRTVKALSKKVIWTPQPKQKIALSRGEDEMLYGGAAGGGKTDYLVVEAARQVNIPEYRGLILRRAVPDLARIIDQTRAIYPSIDRGARYNATTRVWTFSSDAQIKLGSLFRTNEKYKYQGQQYDFIGFDELTQFTFDEYSYLKSRNRGNCKATKVYMRSTANPGGVGHGWVKQYFVTAGTPGETIWLSDKVIMPDGTTKNYWSSKVFITASVFDNNALMNNDPDYVKRLAQLPEAERNALLYGSWDSFEGQVFTEWIDNREHYKDRRWTHVIEPFKIPQSWRIIRSYDWGYTRPFSVGWTAVDQDGRFYRIRELYGCKKNQPNTGVRWPIEKVAQEILAIENNDPQIKGRQIYGVADPAIFAEQGSGKSQAATHAQLGVFWNKGDNARIAGKMQFHSRLAFDEEGYPMFQCFNTCTNFIRTIPNLVYSQIDTEDIDTEGEDHIYDEQRYGFMTSIITPKEVVLRNARAFDPLNICQTRYYR